MNKEKNKENFRQWWIKNKDKHRESTKNRARNNPEPIRERNNRIPAGVYMIKCLVNGKCYIGQSKRPYLRRACHFSTYTTKSNIDKQNLLIKADMKQYGKSAFVFGIIEHCEVDKLLERETYYISKLNPAYNTLKKELAK
jgi:hypothetical protein